MTLTHPGELLENPVTGERGVVRIPPTPANGHLLVADLYLRPGGAVSGEHVHPTATETFTVVRGRLSVRHGGRELRAGPGTRLRVAPGTAHAFWNDAAEEARVVVEVQPGERVAQLIRQRLVQRLLFGALYPLARATGHRAIDPAYLRRELPTVDLEPLPAEIAGLIPSLSTRPRWPNSTTVSAAG
jgi:quercetin dioxygenase-like cupin family protein